MVWVFVLLCSLIKTLYSESFPPSEEMRREAHLTCSCIYDSAKKNPEKYWEAEAHRLEWMKDWDQVLKWEPPHATWFVGGKLNASVNCLDRHVKSGLGKKLAVIWEGERGEEKKITYQELFTEVSRFSNVLKSLGVKKGDRVALYLPMCPEAIAAVLSCARIGAIHTVVFGGFSAEALGQRIIDSEAKILITADGSYRKGKLIPLKKIADEAVARSPSIEKVVVVKHADTPVEMKKGRDFDYNELITSSSPHHIAEAMDAEDPLFILYTSGTTGKPKGIVHTTGGYMVGVTSTMYSVFDIKPEDVFWCTADVGWITGHSYVVYGPLSNGATIFIYEGSPDYPHQSRFFEMIDKYNISIFYTAPTLIRTFMKWGKNCLAGCDLTSLRLLGSVGEPINPEAWRWLHTNIGQGKCPIVDTWWQTETGSIMIAPLPGITTLKAGSATHPLPGIQAEIIDTLGKSSDVGSLIIMEPWPSMMRGIHNDPMRYESYWKHEDGYYYLTGDGAKKDEEGYFWLTGRVDDVINVSGHRLGTAEIESALIEHPLVAEAAVIAVSDEIKGQAIASFVTLKEGTIIYAALEKELKEIVIKKIGSLARPERIIYICNLPKTRSGKIMRRLLRDIAEGRVLGDLSTLSDPAVIEEIKKEYHE